MHTLTINGQPFVPIRTYRARHDLPDEFGVAYFEPKPDEGLARLDGAGDALETLRRATLHAIPATTTHERLLVAIDAAADAFTRALNAVNGDIGLKPEEIDYACAGFRDVLGAWGYAVIRQRPAHFDAAHFDALYNDWIADSVRIAARTFAYTHGGTTYHANIISTVYGRVGLRVVADGVTTYVADAVHACPAQSFMLTLCREAARRLLPVSAG
ncbi:MAG: hypothetical protein EA396_10425 [Anaerolineaceae bacterium]|nr:MAG: hypothetical protein EA396_10425 [Anaerolineaceae bacterium]